MTTNDTPDTAPTPDAPNPKLPWTTPRLETLGSMGDAMQNMTQPPNDGSASPSVS
ncbi:hypothetical protein [Sphingomonas sp.]|uniref:hypothetical protein n=1 Tax=Sphingomonas sp. TaxID=28214 RepID=UPI003D6D06A4